MGRALVPLLFLSGVDAFSLGLSSLRHQRSDTRCFSTEAETHDHARAVTRTRKRPANTRSPACAMTVDSEMELEPRIHGNPEALQRWFFSMGGTLGPVVLADAAEKGWGLRAERDLEVDEIVATIPRSMCLGLLASQRDHRTEYDADTAHEQGPWTGPPCIHALVDQVPEKFADIRLGLLLLHERYKTGSNWQPYVENLPTRVKGVPLSSFGIADMRALQDDKLTEKIDERCTFLLKFVKDVLGPLGTGPDAPFGEKRLEFGDLTWATAAVSSRAFTSLYGGWRQESKPLLVPFIDMLNFSFDQSNVKVVSAWPRGDHDEEVEEEDEEEDEEEEEEERPDKAEVRLITTRRVAAGDSLEVRENYTNAERLYKYGFVERDRRKERSPFTFEKKVMRAARIVVGILDEPFGSRFGVDELEPWQQRVLRDLRLDGPNADLTVYLGGDSTRGRLPVDDRILAALRVMFSRSKQELEGKTAAQLGRYKEGKLSVYVEQRVLATVLGLGNVYVQQWWTTITHDEMMLYGRQVSPSLEEALNAAPPWQELADEDVTLRDMLIKRLMEEEEVEELARAGEETSGEGGGTGVEDEGGDQEGEREESEEEEERGQGEGREEEYDHHDGILEVNPELSWEMAQSVAYRLAKKRSIIDLALLARAEMRRTGLSEGMVENTRANVGPLSDWLSDGSIRKRSSSDVDAPDADQRAE